MVSGKKRSEAAAVSENENFVFSAELHYNDIPMWVFDRETLAFLAVNDVAIERYGYSRDQFLAMTILDIRPSEDVIPLLQEELRDRKHNSVGETWRHRTKDGAVIRVKISSRAIIFEGRPAEIVSATDCLR